MGLMCTPLQLSDEESAIDSTGIRAKYPFHVALRDCRFRRGASLQLESVSSR